MIFGVRLDTQSDKEKRPIAQVVAVSGILSSYFGVLRYIMVRLFLTIDQQLYE